MLLSKATSKVTAKNRATDVRPKVVELTSVAYNQGVLPEELVQLVDLVISRSYLDQASLNSIIRNLYPVAAVSEDVVLRIIGSLGLGELKPSLALQSSLLQWVIQVYYVLDARAQGVLARAYGVLFSLLDVSATRPQLFHILAIITRRKHVQHHRIQALLNLTRQNANDRHLQGLLRVYRNYYPEIIVDSPGKGSTFKLPDPEWKDRLSVIQRMHREMQQQTSASSPRDGFKTVQHHLAGTKGARAAAAVPGVQTSNAHEKSVTLEEIDSAESLALNVEKVELPDHLAAVLIDPLLQKFMLLRPDKDWKRAWVWMNMQISEIVSGDADEDALIHTLKVIREYAQATKDISPFFHGLVKLVGNRLHLRQGGGTQIYDVLAYAPIMDSKDLSAFVAALQSSLDGSAEAQLDLLELYTKLIRRWGATLLSSDAVPPHTSSCLATITEQANQLSLTLLQTSPTEYTLLKILDFYERVASIYSRSHVLRSIQITIPPVLLVYTLQFSTCLATVSRLCTILTAYKQACAVYMSNAAKKLGPPYDKVQVNTFNGFLMDICNCLWRGKAFVRSDAHARGCMVGDGVIAALRPYVASLTDSGSGDMALEALFTMSYSPLLCLQAMDHVRQLEEQEDEDVELRARHAGPITQRSLGQLARQGGLELVWQNYRLGVLQHLSDKEWRGISDLMYSTMRNLLDAKAKA
ncbi:Mis6-domain-containing protein [Cryphonectria parasitica EP155]|uniref:Mis6-domain-containing protein n=1 Tax=Cryphonectria parasitica (strain ATCC 38755 / EP155) TaxID=660469 RepID=A0A9P4YEI3_CRYP1|nr:Mis6-domain-containing protein [Cryphonectria parasitica EP155]KAF3771237.1 Mis6-domain-containing protein [Cryphonectria parasitica EP155]